MKTNQSVLITFVILVSVAGCLSAPIHKFNGRAGALKYDTIVAFGDSTCDNGNGTYTLLNHTYPPSPPYYNGRFSNGPVFMEYLSNILNATLYDYAYGGATSDNTYVTGVSGFNYTSVVPSVTDQVKNIYGPKALKGVDFDKILFVISYQGNDYLDNPKADPLIVVSKLAETWSLLASYGAKHILTNTFFDISLIPYARTLPTAVQLALKAISAAHNAALVAAVDIWNEQGNGAEVLLFPLGESLAGLQQPEKIAQLGITDVTNPCITRPPGATNAVNIPCEDPSKFFFWDSFHPTTKVGEQVALSIYNFLASLA
ncbi:3558_t:CDS:2 [Paraglomus brasilianum]|uniref:3558_t:CDS:1 n=1 Tax=Paraglomus brasilianum TaxID=144538 RepID=A0A9N8ZM63_9GLOM|nr:3558_t:CDS:2 [Paraglomus brasilianum]